MRGKCFNVDHNDKGSSKLGITALGQASQVQCGNGPKSIPIWQSYLNEHFRFKNEKNLQFQFPVKVKNILSI